MIQYFYGEDVYGARQEIGGLVKAGGNLRWLDKEDLEEKSLGLRLQQTGGLFGSEVLVVYDVAELPKGMRDEIEKVVGKEVNGDVVLWDRKNALDKRSKMWKLVKGQSKEFRVPDSWKLVGWLQEEAKGLGGEISDGAARELVSRVGIDRWRMRSELERLLLVDANVREDLVRQEVATKVSEDVFVVIGAVARKNKQQAIVGVEKLLEMGESELYVLAMLVYQFRTLLTIVQGKTDKLQPFVVKKNVDKARQFSERQLVDILTKILATDFAIKRGKVDPRTGLIMLVVGITQ